MAVLLLYAYLAVWTQALLVPAAVNLQVHMHGLTSHFIEPTIIRIFTRLEGI